MTAPAPERPWFRLSLRTLFAVVTLAAVCLGWLTWQMRGAERQRAAATEIIKGFGSVRYDQQYQPTRMSRLAQSCPAWLVKRLGNDFFSSIVFATVRTDDDFQYLADLSQLKILDQWGTSVSDAGLVHLQGLRQLESIELRQTKVTGEGLKYLTGLPRLKSLSLMQTSVTDESLRHLAGMKQLQSLNLYGTQISDAGLVHLQGLTGLQTLNLYDTKVTDAGLKHLAGLSALRSLDISEREVTTAGLKKLQQTLPNCDIRPLSATVEAVPERGR